MISVGLAQAHPNIYYIQTDFVMLRMLLQLQCILDLYLYRSEMMIIMKAALIQGISFSIFFFSMPVILFVTFSVYASVGGTLTPKRVFTTLSLLSLIRLTSVQFIVQASLMLSEAGVAIQRIQVLFQMHALYCSF